MTEPVRIGLVGLGSVAQTVHVPVLKSLSDRFNIVAGCDVSETLRNWAEQAVPGLRAFADYRDMLAAGGLDAVAVINSDEYHADVAVAALEAGAHVLIEKPLALTLPDAERIIAARDAAGRQAMVGYMRRMAGGFAIMQDAIAQMDAIEHVSVRDYIPSNAYFISQVNREIAPTDIADDAKAERQARRRAMLTEATASDDAHRHKVYSLLCGLSSHDLSAMRDLVGAPQGVIAAAARRGGSQISAMFDHGGFISTFETGIDSVGDFDAHIEVFGGNIRARIDYDNPYIRHLPTLVRIRSSDGDGFSDRVERETFTDPYTRQWRIFADVVAGTGQNPTPPEDSVHDLVLFAQIMDRLVVIGR